MGPITAATRWGLPALALLAVCSCASPPRGTPTRAFVYPGIRQLADLEEPRPGFRRVLLFNSDDSLADLSAYYRNHFETTDIDDDPYGVRYVLGGHDIMTAPATVFAAQVLVPPRPRAPGEPPDPLEEIDEILLQMLPPDERALARKRGRREGPEYLFLQFYLKSERFYELSNAEPRPQIVGAIFFPGEPAPAPASPTPEDTAP